MFRRHRERKLAHKWRIKASSMDMWKAYKHFAVHPDELPLNIIEIVDPTSLRSCFCISFVMVFGKTGAVLQFDRCPVFLTALARRLLAVRSQHFFDDFRLTDPTIGDDSARTCFSKLADLLGFKFDPSKTQ
jgi:hypothetical protein